MNATDGHDTEPFSMLVEVPPRLLKKLNKELRERRMKLRDARKVDYDHLLWKIPPFQASLTLRTHWQIMLIVGAPSPSAFVAAPAFHDLSSPKPADKPLYPYFHRSAAVFSASGLLSLPHRQPAQFES